MALITPLVSEQFPYVPLTVTVRGRSASVLALIDTGFNGDLILPASAVAPTAQPDGYFTWRMVDASPLQTPVYLGTVQIGTFAPLAVVIAIVGDEPLIGRTIIDRFRLTLDHGRRVIVDA